MTDIKLISSDRPDRKQKVKTKRKKRREKKSEHVILEITIAVPRPVIMAEHPWHINISPLHFLNPALRTFSFIHFFDKITETAQWRVSFQTAQLYPIIWSQVLAAGGGGGGGQVGPSIPPPPDIFMYYTKNLMMPCERSRGSRKPRQFVFVNSPHR